MRQLWCKRFGDAAVETVHWQETLQKGMAYPKPAEAVELEHKTDRVDQDFTLRSAENCSVSSRDELDCVLPCVGVSEETRIKPRMHRADRS